MLVDGRVRLASMGDVQQRLELVDGGANGTTLDGLADGIEGIVVDNGAGSQGGDNLGRSSNSGGGKCQEGAEKSLRVHLEGV